METITNAEIGSVTEVLGKVAPAPMTLEEAKTALLGLEKFGHAVALAKSKADRARIAKAHLDEDLPDAVKEYIIKAEDEYQAAMDAEAAAGVTSRMIDAAAQKVLDLTPAPVEQVEA